MVPGESLEAQNGVPKKIRRLEKGGGGTRGYPFSNGGA